MPRKGVSNSFNQKPPGLVSYNSLYARYQYEAKKRNSQSFDLDKDTFIKIVGQDCYYCGAKPRDFTAYHKNRGDITPGALKLSIIKANGVDRLDSNLGYIKGNCVPCCSTCNTMKLDSSLNVFIQHVFQIARHLVKRKFKINPFF